MLWAGGSIRDDHDRRFPAGRGQCAAGLACALLSMLLRAIIAEERAVQGHPPDTVAKRDAKNGFGVHMATLQAHTAPRVPTLGRTPTAFMSDVSTAITTALALIARLNRPQGGFGPGSCAHGAGDDRVDVHAAAIESRKTRARLIERHRQLGAGEENGLGAGCG